MSVHRLPVLSPYLVRYQFDHCFILCDPRSPDLAYEYQHNRFICKKCANFKDDVHREVI